MPSPEGKVARRSRDGRGVTAVRFRRMERKNETLYRTSPAPYGGTLPKGEGLRLRRQTIICKAKVFFGILQAPVH